MDPCIEGNMSKSQVMDFKFLRSTEGKPRRRDEIRTEGIGVQILLTKLQD
jgi:hypothetical protein